MVSKLIVLTKDDFRHVRQTIDDSIKETKIGRKLPIEIRKEITIFLLQRGRWTDDAYYDRVATDRLNFSTVDGSNFTILENTDGK